MSTAIQSLPMAGLEELRKHRIWFLVMGILLIALGVIAVGSSALTTLATMVFVGWLMIGSGIVQAIHAFACKAWSGFFLDLLAGILYSVVGFMIVASPEATAVTLTLLIAVSLIFGGIFRIVVAIAARFPNWIWLLLHGIVNVMLGIAIWRQWPLSGMWLIGFFIGIDLTFNGWSLVMLAIAAKKLPSEQTIAAIPARA